MKSKPNTKILSECVVSIMRGENMHTWKYTNGIDTWTYPKGMESNIEDNKLYKVWYKVSDTADTCDPSCQYSVKWVEEYIHDDEPKHNNK